MTENVARVVCRFALIARGRLLRKRFLGRLVLADDRSVASHDQCK